MAVHGLWGISAPYERVHEESCRGRERETSPPPYTSHAAHGASVLRCARRRASRRIFSCSLFRRPYLTGRATIGRLELPPGEGRFVGPPYEKPPHA